MNKLPLKEIERIRKLCEEHKLPTYLIDGEKYYLFPVEDGSELGTICKIKADREQVERNEEYIKLLEKEKVEMDKWNSNGGGWSGIKEDVLNDEKIMNSFMREESEYNKMVDMFEQAASQLKPHWYLSGTVICIYIVIAAIIGSFLWVWLR